MLKAMEMHILYTNGSGKQFIGFKGWISKVL